MNPPLDMPVTSNRCGSTQNDDDTAAERSSKNSRSFTPSTPAKAPPSGLQRLGDPRASGSTRSAPSSSAYGAYPL
jgi:hypothetical protein